jgi:hypothetical protein
VPAASGTGLAATVDRMAMVTILDCFVPHDRRAPIGRQERIAILRPPTIR